MEEKRKRKIFGLAFIIAVFFVLSASFALYPVFAAYPATKYAPGETTNPDCSPTDPNCNVYAPITTNSVGDYAVSSLAGGGGFIVSNATGTVVLNLDIDSTLTTSTKLGINLSNANTWLAMQTFSASTTMASTSITYLTSGNANITGGSLSGVTGNISMWTNNANYITTSTEIDSIWTAASTSYAKLSLNNTFAGSNTFAAATFSGFVGIGTTTVDSRLTVADGNIVVRPSGSGGVYVLSPNDAVTAVRGNERGYMDIAGDVDGGETMDSAVRLYTRQITTPDWVIGDDNSDDRKFKISYGVYNPGSSDYLTIDRTGKIGIGTATPSTTLHIVSTAEQLRLGYNSANYTSFTIGTDGALTIAPTNSATTTISGVLASTGGNSTNWNTAFSQTLQWSGGSTGLTAATGRTSLGLGTMSLENNTGTTTITTLGTIGTGTWQGTLVSSTYGGTNKNTSNWTGFSYITNGVWSTSTAVTVESDPIWTAASAGYANLSLNNTFTGASTFATTTASTSTVTSVLYLANGTADVPSLAFTNDTNSGFYSIGTDNIGLSLNGTLAVNFGITTTTITGDLQSSTGLFRTTDAGAISAILRGTMANGASGVGVILDNTVSQATAGGKLVSIRNANVEKAYIDYLGSFNAGTGTALLPAYSFAGDPDTGMWRNGTNAIGFVTNGVTRADLDANGFNSDVFKAYNSGSTASVSLKGRVTDTATAVATVLDNFGTALTTAGGKITSFRTNAAEKAYVDYLGDFFAGAGTALIPAFGFVGDVDTGMYWASANNLGLTTSGTERMRIDGSGNVGIGTSTPAFKFQVYVDASNEGHVAATGDWARTSDISLKKNIIGLDSALEKVMSLRGVRYDWINDENATGSTHIGFIAQELEQIFPEFVSEGNNGIKGVAYGALTPVLVEAIKEQQGEIANLALVLPADFTSSTINGLKIDDNVLTTDIITGQELNNFDWLVKNSLKKLGMLIKDGIAKFKELIAGKITAQNELCVGSTCVNEDQLKNILNNNPTPTPVSEPAPTPAPEAPAIETPAAEPAPIVENLPAPSAPELTLEPAPVVEEPAPVVVEPIPAPVTEVSAPEMLTE